MNELMQPLESRQLLSADLTNGVLTVTGTAKNDAIVISLNKAGDTITVKERASSRFKRGSVTTSTFAAADVTSIVVDAGAGNDLVQLKGTRDTAFTIAASISGGAGADRLFGAAGNDTIDGGAGEDDLFGGDGDDLLNGGDDDDLLNGGDGADSLNGGAGDDLLIAIDDDTTDVIDGGDDSAAAGEDDADIAVVDDGETASNATTQSADEWMPPFHGPGFGGGHGHGGAKGGASKSGSDTSSSATFLRAL